MTYPNPQMNGKAIRVAASEVPEAEFVAADVNKHCTLWLRGELPNQKTMPSVQYDSFKAPLQFGKGEKC